MLLKVSHLSKSFDQQIVVNDLSFELSIGKCLGIVGESGSGKSTLAKMIVRLVNPDQGTIYFEDQEVKDYTHKALFKVGRHIQYIYQNPMSAFMPRMKIKQFMLEPYLNYHLKNKTEALMDIKYLLKEVELDESCLDKYPHQLSGGQLQRIVIARAISLNPKLIICDEITSALDVIVQEEIIALLKKLIQKKKISILFISHDNAIVSKISDELLVMYQGQCVEKLTQLSEAMHPYTKELIKNVTYSNKS